MANLSFNEKQLIETVFEMGSGYVLDFKINRIFSEFMQDVVQYEIFQKYPGLSKAKIIREFIKDESDIYVGKLILMLIKYMDDNDLITEEKREKTKKLSELGMKLLGKTKHSILRQQVKSANEDTSKIDFDNLNISLLAIDNLNDHQARGYAFEKYLNTLFKTFDLNPHASYRTEYDQIDGSFTLNGSTIIIEAKYKTKPIPKNDLILFENVVKTKSHFSKGLFITYSPLEDKTIEYFSNKGSRLIVLTVEELFLICQNRYSLSKLLIEKFRILDEYGTIFKHVLSIL